MRQLITCLIYFFEYPKHGDIRSIITSVQYVLFNTSHKNLRLKELQNTVKIFPYGLEEYNYQTCFYETRH